MKKTCQQLLTMKQFWFKKTGHRLDIGTLLITHGASLNGKILKTFLIELVDVIVNSRSLTVENIVDDANEAAVVPSSYLKITSSILVLLPGSFGIPEQ